MKITPYLFSSFLPSCIKKGPNMSTSQFVYGGPWRLLSVGGSAIFCSQSFPLTRQHLIHFPYKLLTTALHLNTQKPLLLTSLTVSPLPPWTVFWWHHSTNKAVVLLVLPIRRGWMSLKWKSDFFNLPLTLNDPSLSRSGSRLYISLFFFICFSF